MLKKSIKASKQISTKKNKATKPLIDNDKFKRIGKFRSFVRGNRDLKLANRSLIARNDYLMIQQFGLRELMEFRFAVFMLYHFGLRMSEIVCMTNINVKELVDTGTTVIVSTLMHTVRRLYAPQPILKELFRFETEIWDLFFNYRTRKTKYVMADRKGNPFSPLDVSEVINERLDDITNYMDFEEEHCWSIESLRGGCPLTKNLGCSNNFFARYGYENRWFYTDEDSESDLILEPNFTITYYITRILEEEPYEHHSGFLVDKAYLKDNVRSRSAISKKDKELLSPPETSIEPTGDESLNIYLEGCTLFTVGPEEKID